MQARLKGGSELRKAAQLKKEYFEYLVSLIHGPEWHGHSYSRLLAWMDRTPFFYVLDRDRNRAIDGTDLRYRFGFERDISKQDIQEILDVRECSVLEMIVALAHRCEENIMTVEEEGDRTGTWFFEMMKSLGLDKFYNQNFDPSGIMDILNNFMLRQYEKNGQGGLFTIHGQPRMDMRNVEIWYQMMAWLIEKDEGGLL